MPEREYQPIWDQSVNDAHKINKLVNEGEVTTTEASEASWEEIDAMIAKIFDKKFSQNYFRPWEMREKTLGQKAEDLLIEILNHFPWFHARHGSDREDAVRKTDLVLSIEGTNREIPIQFTTARNRTVIKEKRKHLPKDVLLIRLPLEDINQAYENRDEQSLKSVIERFVRQLLEQLKKIPDYLPVYEDLQEQLATAA
jgi:hypothetical protein